MAKTKKTTITQGSPFKDQPWVEQAKADAIEQADRNHWGPMVHRTILPDRLVMTFESGQQIVTMREFTPHVGRTVAR